MKKVTVHVTLIATLSLMASPITAAQPAGLGSPASVEQGRYLVKIAQCNNCHTDGYSASGGAIPEQKWLIGNSRSWQEKIGTVYATNLRLVVSEISEDAWVIWAKNLKSRPPMPWWSLRDMSENDLRSMYRFIRYLGPAGTPARPFEPAANPTRQQ